MAARGSRRARHALPEVSAPVGQAGGEREQEQESLVAPEQGQALGQERPALRAADQVVAQVAALVVAVVLVRISVPGGRSGVEVLMSWSRSRYPVSPPRMLRCRKARSRYPAA